MIRGIDQKVTCVLRAARVTKYSQSIAICVLINMNSLLANISHMLLEAPRLEIANLIEEIDWKISGF